MSDEKLHKKIVKYMNMLEKEDTIDKGLQRLESIPMTFDMLKQTMVSKKVSGLSRRPEYAERVKNLVAGWGNMAARAMATPSPPVKNFGANNAAENSQWEEAEQGHKEANKSPLMVSKCIDNIQRQSPARRDALNRLAIRHLFEGQINNQIQNENQTPPRQATPNNNGLPIQATFPDLTEQQSFQQESPRIRRNYSLPSTTPIRTINQVRPGPLRQYPNGLSPCGLRLRHSASSASASPTFRYCHDLVTASPSGCPTAIFDDTLLGAHIRSHSVDNTPTENANGNRQKLRYILDELLYTEQSYVRELREVVDNYVLPFGLACADPGSSCSIPVPLRGQADMLFGNIREIQEFHQRFLLAELQRHADSAVGVARVLTTQHGHFLTLYRPYCQNKPMSEQLRTEHAVDQCKFFVECQRHAGHVLPLSAYLLKPVQRITKYHLLLKELLRNCDAESRPDVQVAVSTMLDLLSQINTDMQQFHILGYPSDLRILGLLRLQTECNIYPFKRKTARRSSKNIQKRHLFLFDDGILFCKKRVRPLQFTPEYYEHKLYIPMHSLGFAECSRSLSDRFEIWDVNKSDGYAVQTVDECVRPKWIQRLAKATILNAQQQSAMIAAAQGLPDSQQLRHNFSNSASALLQKPNGKYQPNQQQQRPQSWTSSSEECSSGGGGGSATSSSSTSTVSSRSSTTDDSLIPSRNSQQTMQQCYCCNRSQMMDSNDNANNL